MSLDEAIYDLDRTCRICSKISEQIMTPFFNDPLSCQDNHPEILEEIAFFNIELQEYDGLPQQICPSCHESFLAINKFRKRCKEIQDIMKVYFNKIKTEPNNEIEKIQYLVFEPGKEVEWFEDSVYVDDTECIQENSVDLQDTELIQNLESIEELKNDDSESNDIEGSEHIQNSESIQNSDSAMEDESIVDSDDGLSEINWKCEYFIPPEYDDGKDPIKEKKEIKENKYFCKYCNKGFPLSHAALNHMRFCPDRNEETCKLCLAIFQTDEQLKAHLEAMHSKNDKPTCPICSRSFSTISGRNIHLNIFHAPGPKPTCEQCQRSFKNKRSLKQHIERVHTTVDRECPICKRKFTNEFRYKYHLLSHDAKKKFQCQYCDKSFLQAHHKKIHELSHTGERPYLCCFCGKSFRYDEAYKYHLMRYHPDEATEEMIGNASLKKSSVSKRYPCKTNSCKCDVCGKILSSKNCLKLHMYLHNDVNYRGHTCPYCDKVFQTKINLRYHTFTVHSGKTVDNNDEQKRQYPFSCSVCAKGFTVPVALADHIKTHSEERPHVCKECGCSFKRDSHLKNHTRRIHLKIKEHKCIVCDKMFADRCELNGHMVTHSDIRPFNCSYCERTFKRRTEQRIHERSHTGEKPFGCEICPSRFVTSISLATHIMIKHSDNENKAVEQNILGTLEQSNKTVEIQKSDYIAAENDFVEVLF